ncbi:TonB-dependent receptor [Phenylobacterium sp.]|uniref:TonB-dependent receptor n=1 Tax=Phenylobacterium sp. TaxID=1871053 RepID=UPI002F3F4842
MQHKARLLASSALLIAAALGSSAHAQVKSATNAAAAAAAGAGNTIEELVVTAEKRSQSLQDVPVAITAFSSQTRDLVGINSIQDLTNFTPGLNYSSGNDRNSIRGVGRLTNSHPIANAVALYDDGVFSSSTVPAGKTPIYTDRVEVLRGPQGTLYGRNSIGGAINVISKRPTEDPYAEIRGVIGNYGYNRLEAAVSGPLAPDLQFRLVGSWEKQRDGYFTNIVPGMPSEGNVIDQWELEGQLQGKVSDKFDFWGKAELIGWNNGGGGPGARNGYSTAPFNFGEFAALSPSAGFACAPGGVVSNVVNTSPLGCVNPASRNPRDFASNYAQSVSLDDTYVITFQGTYHMDGADLKYIGGGSKYHYTLQTDNGGGSISSFTINPGAVDPLLALNTSTQPCPLSNAFVAPGSCAGLTVFPENIQTYQEDFLNYSHEFNLTSTGNGPFQWLAGLYYYREHIIQPVFQTEPQQPQLNPGSAVQIGAAQDFMNRTFDDRPDMQDESYAVFGQIDWKFTDTLKTTLGIRWSHDHEFGSESGRDVCFATVLCGSTPQLFGQFSFPLDLTPLGVFFSGGLPSGVVKTPGSNAGGVTFTPDGFGHRSYDGSWSATTGTAGLQWDPEPGTMMYARYNRGYKQGGFQVGAVAFGGQFPETNPEHMNDYEVGIKKDLFNRTLQIDLALFYYDYLGLQAPLTVINNTGAIAASQSIFLNVPKSYSEGAELEATWAPIDKLRILFDYSFNPTGIKTLSGIIDPADPLAVQPGAKPLVGGALVPCTSSNAAVPGGNVLCDTNTGFVERPQNMKGNVLPNATRNKVAINILYTFDTEIGSIIPSVDYLWRDKQYSGIFKRDYYASPSWDQVDARITWKSKNDKFTAIAYIKNAFNRLGYDSGAGASRQSGLFPLATIAAANGAITPGATSTPASTNGGVPGLIQSGVLTGFGPGGITQSFPLTPPRTFGIELQYKF